MVVAAWLVAGCGSSGQGPAGGRFASWPTVTMIAFNDQWASALPRYYDIADLLFKKDLAPGTIQFRYDPSPTDPYLVGEIKGWGLKPNFCYQLKLMGKPGVAGAASSRAKPVKPTPTTGLWGSEADMATNSAILTNARWWSYSQETANFNTTSPATVMASQDYANGWVAGYVYFGYVLTDENGTIKCYGGKTAPVMADASGWVPISANRCYHITGKTGQESNIGLASDTSRIPYTLTRTSYGYTSTASASLSLWYEKEPDNALDFALPAGQHDVVLMITEESFHNNLGGLTSTTDGGFWDSVWVSDWPTKASPKTGGYWTTQRGGRIQFVTGSTAAAPSVSVVSPANGGSVEADALVTVKIKAIASRDLAVTLSVDGAASVPALYNEASACYEGQWSTAGLTLGSSHTILATATDSQGAIAMATSQVTVAGNQAPVAAFTSSASGLMATLTSTSTDPDGTISGCAWQFGDGTTGSGASVSHTYAAAGTYLVTLTVTDNGGATNSTTGNVTVAVAAHIMAPSILVQWLGSAGKYQPNAVVTVMADGAPLAGATVTGNFSGLFNSRASSVVTGADGKALFYGPPRNATKGALTFTVTGLVKTGYTAGTLPVSASYVP